jgi:hypothetical protein
VLEGVTARAFQVIDRGIYYLERDANTVVTLMGPQASVGLESDEHATLQFFDFSDARTRTLAHLRRPIAIGLAVSRDGRTVLYTQVDDVAGDLMMVENFR